MAPLGCSGVVKVCHLTLPPAGGSDSIYLLSCQQSDYLRSEVVRHLLDFRDGPGR